MWTAVAQVFVWQHLDPSLARVVSPIDVLSLWVSHYHSRLEVYYTSVVAAVPTVLAVVVVAGEFFGPL